MTCKTWTGHKAVSLDLAEESVVDSGPRQPSKLVQHVTPKDCEPPKFSCSFCVCRCLAGALQGFTWGLLVMSQSEKVLKQSLTRVRIYCLLHHNGMVMCVCLAFTHLIHHITCSYSLQAGLGCQQQELPIHMQAATKNNTRHWSSWQQQCMSCVFALICINSEPRLLHICVQLMKRCVGSTLTGLTLP